MSPSLGLGLSVTAVPVGVGVPSPVGEIVGLVGGDVGLPGDVEPLGELGLLDEDGDVECDLEQRAVSAWVWVMMSWLVPADSVGDDPTGGI